MVFFGRSYSVGTQGISVPDLANESDIPTPETIQKSRRQLQETRKLQSALNARISQNNALLQQLRELISGSSSTIKSESPPLPGANRFSSPNDAFSFLTRMPSADALGVLPIAKSTSDPNPPGPIEVNTSFTISQLPALRSLLAELRPRLLAANSATSGSASESVRERDRKLYLEKQTQKVLGRRRVAVADGMSSTIGRKIMPEETTALESIVQSLAGDGGDRMEE